MQFQILGPLRVTDGDEREIALGGDKPAALLAMLVLRSNEFVPTDRLIEDLWDGQPPATAAKTLQVHMSRLRRALGNGPNGNDDGLIATSRGGYALRAEPDQIDALRFQALLNEGMSALAEGAHARASTRLRAALALWRGEALADFTYASFAQDEIARLDGLRMVALESAVDAELALGRHTELIPELKALVKRNPLSEHLRAQLMLALYRAGRQAEALGVYRAAHRALVGQLGLEPSAELRDLERAILAQDAQLAVPAPQAPARRKRSEKPQRGALVGYERELSALEELLEQSLTGQGGLALISGEPGVGKTRLADELASVAHARGAQVVWGRCRVAEGAPPYWPWMQVLRGLCADRDPMRLRAELGANASDLTQLLPELRDVMPDLAPADRADAEEARFRLFDAVAAFLSRAAADRPVVIVLDDIHAADRSTLSLLDFAAGAALDASALIVGTYRDTEVAADPPLSETLNELARATDCLQLVLTGLSTEATAHFVELTAGVTPMPVLAGAIHDASSGNPLFVTELVRLLRAENRLNELEEGDVLVLPRGVEQVIARRLQHLSDPCRRTLSFAAVIGREFDVALLERAGDAHGDELLAHIDDAEAARVVDRVTGRRFRFSHELVRNTLDVGLRAVERRRMHEAIANALEDQHAAHPESVAAELAYHFSEALPGGDAVKAAHYLTLAGDAAARPSGYAEAAAHYARAAEIAKANGADPAELCELNLRLGEQLVLLTDLDGAKMALDEAEALAADAPDHGREARLAVARVHLGLGDALAFGEDKVFDAIALFQELGDPAAEAQAWGALGTVACGQSARLKHGQAAAAMLECAKRAGNRGLVGEALRSLAFSLSLGPTPISEALPRARSLLHETDDPMARARILRCVGLLEAKAGRFDEARAVFAEALATAPASQRADFRSYLSDVSAQVEYWAGNHRRAEEAARECCADMESRGLVRYLSTELMFLVDPLIAQGQLEEADAQLKRAAPLAAPDDFDALFRQARSRARLELARGDLEAAEAAASKAMEYVLEDEVPDEIAETWLVLAEVRLAGDREDEAREAAEKALRVSQARENAVFAQKASEFLGALQVAAR